MKNDSFYSLNTYGIVNRESKKKHIGAMYTVNSVNSSKREVSVKMLMTVIGRGFSEIEFSIYSLGHSFLVLLKDKT